MNIQLKFSIKQLLRVALQGEATEVELSKFSKLFEVLAKTLVRRKIISGKINLDIVRMTEHDIVTDCIADLFKRNDDGVLVELSNYFKSQSISIDEHSDEYLLTHLRKLVSNAVNDGVFRLYNEADPALGKIIRNIKIAVEKSEQFALEDFCGEQYLMLCNADILPHLTTIGDEELQHETEIILARHYEMPEILNELASFLCVQETFQRKVKLISLAVACKRGFEAVSAMSSVKNDEADYYMVAEDTRSLILDTCKEFETELRPRYVLKGKVDDSTFTSYMKALDQILCDEFVEGRNGELTYYEQVKQFIPDVTQNDYTKHHRIIFEYFAKLAKKRLREKLKEM